MIRQYSRRIPDDDWKPAAARAEIDGYTMTDVVRRILDAYINQGLTEPLIVIRRPAGGERGSGHPLRNWRFPQHMWEAASRRARAEGYTLTDVIIGGLGRYATPTCTGMTATWCPRCGDCSCPYINGQPEQGRTLNDPTCQLHAPSSPHAEVQRAAQT